MKRENSYNAIIDSVIDMEEEKAMPAIPEQTLTVAPLFSITTDQTVPSNLSTRKSKNGNSTAAGDFINDFANSIVDSEVDESNHSLASNLTTDDLLTSIEKGQPILDFTNAFSNSEKKVADQLSTINISDIPTAVLEGAEESKDSMRDDEDTEDEEYQPSARPTRKSSRRKRKDSAFVTDFDDFDAEEEKPASKRRRGSNASDKAGSKKRKLYECPAFDDPVMEKKRQDAIHAKENRDRKKREKNALERQMSAIRKENDAALKREAETRAVAIDAMGSVEYLLSIVEASGLRSSLAKDKLAKIESLRQSVKKLKK